MPQTHKRTRTLYLSYISLVDYNVTCVCLYMHGVSRKQENYKVSKEPVFPLF